MSTLQEYNIAEVAILQPNSIIIYKEFPRKAREQTQSQLANLEKGKAGAYNGYMSPATAKKTRNMLSTWLTALEFNIQRLPTGTRIINKYYPTFVTLTLPAEQMHDDNFIKRNMLDRLLQKMKDKYEVQHYFWRAEPQKNGNVHFHILLDKFVKWSKLRAEWNHILDVYGYIELYRRNQQEWHKNGFKVRKELIRYWSEARQKEAYDTGIKNNWSDPNSTDIHKIQKVKSLAAYVTKYVTKTDTTGRKIGGRIWGCSDALRKLKLFRETACIMSPGSSLPNPQIIDYIDKVQAETPPERIYEDEYVKVIKLKDTQINYLKRYDLDLFKQYKNYYNQVLRELYILPIFEVPEPEPKPEVEFIRPEQIKLFRQTSLTF